MLTGHLATIQHHTAPSTWITYFKTRHQYYEVDTIIRLYLQKHRRLCGWLKGPSSRSKRAVKARSARLGEHPARSPEANLASPRAREAHVLREAGGPGSGAGRVTQCPASLKGVGNSRPHPQAERSAPLDRPSGWARTRRLQSPQTPRERLEATTTVLRFLQQAIERRGPGRALSRAVSPSESL